MDKFNYPNRIRSGVLKGSGNNVIKTPMKNNNIYPNKNSTQRSSLEEENRRLKDTLAQKEQLIRSFQRRIATLEQKNRELQDKLRDKSNKRSKTVNRNNNYHNNHSNNQGYYDDFSNNFFNNDNFFSDPFFQNIGTGNYHEPPQRYQETSNIEDDIINQLYPNPDNMTYEQLLALEEDLGSVSKGLSKMEISVNYYLITFS